MIPLLIVALALAVMVVPALAPAAAQAHAAVVSSRPAAGETAASLPPVVVVRFTEPIHPTLSRAAVVGPAGRRWDGTPRGAHEIEVPVAGDAPGTYEVVWTTVSLVDGHTLRGSFQFGVRVDPGEGAAGEIAVAPRPADLALAAARAVEYAALLLVVGRWLLRRLAAGAPGQAWVRVGRTGLTGPLLAALAAGVVVVAGEALNAAPQPSPGAVLDYVRGGQPGAMRVLRIAAEGLAALASIRAPQLATAIAVVAFGALSAAGHAAAVRPAWLGIAVDWLHLLAAGLWVGGIMALAGLRPADGWRGPAARALLARFSPVALAAFGVTVATGVARGAQELTGLADLTGSAYGQVLAAKVGAVAAMVPFSLLAWRRRAVFPRAEAAAGGLVIAAAALLAAFPLPPARAGEAGAPAAGAGAQPGGERQTALPRAADVTLGGNAGETLVGLTLRPGHPGRNEVVLYVRPAGAPPGAPDAPPAVTVSAGARTVATERCGPFCLAAALDLRGDERLEVRLAGGGAGGAAVFDVPPLPAPDGAALLRRARSRMLTLQTYRVYEEAGPPDAPTRALYEYQAPDRLRVQREDGSERVLIGSTRYERKRPDAPWKVVSTASTAAPDRRVPGLPWDVPAGQVVAPRIVGAEQLGAVPTEVVSFFVGAGTAPTWFTVWIDGEGLVRRAQVRSPGRLAEHRYLDFDAPLRIEAPPRGEPPS